MEKQNFEQTYFSDIYDGFYDLRNPKYKFVSYFNQIKRYLVLKKETKLLDIGCAYGSFLKIAKEYVSVSGTDISAHAVEEAKKRLPGTNLFVSNVLELKTDEQYNAITCFDVLEHVQELDQALQHLKKMLPVGGILVITVPVYDTIIGKLVEKLDKDPTHVHKNSRYWWLEKLKENNFEVVKWTGIWRYFLMQKQYIHFISSLTKSFTPAVMIISKNR